jgi:putative heme-binding domain-containing protein
MDSYPKMKGEPRSRARSLLLSRPNTAKSFLELIDSGKLPKTELTPDQVRPLLEFKVEPLTKLIEKHYGKLAAATPGEKQARISWLNIQIPKGKPDLANGKELFTKHCAVCHQLFGEGGKIGPDLTTSDRKNRGYLLTHIVDPSLYIRPEYVSYVVNTFDGRKLSGLVSEQGESITLTNVVENKEQKITLAKKDIEEMRPSAVSIMPEKLLDTISEDEVRNLFAYVQSDPKKEPEKTPPAKKEGKKLSVLLISGSLEYESDKSLTKLQEFLEKNHSIECLRAFRKTDTDLPGLEQLEKCDLAIFFTRRLTIEGEQLDRVKKYLASGKPVIGIRTASHGFQKYLEMDQDIFGGDYKGHHGNKLECQISIPKEAKESPLLKNVNEFKTIGSLYKNANIAKDCNVVLTGSIEKFSYPVAWTRERNGQRIFYTSLGYQDDFSNDNFNQLIVNAIEWCTKK